MFHKSAAYYDLIYRELKDYVDEATKLDYLLNLFDPKPKRILDVGCGTGEHAMHLAKNFGYQMDGIDIEPDLVEIAAQKIPDGDFSVADMRAFKLPHSYDAIICLFSAIGYVETEQGLRDTFASMAKHLKPGGWLVCEPWVGPDVWTPGELDVVEATDPETGETATRTRVGETDGNVSILKIEYDITGENGTRHLEEDHRLGLFTQDQTTEALEAAGFAPRWAEQGLHGYPFVVATYVP